MQANKGMIQLLVSHCLLSNLRKLQQVLLQVAQGWGNSRAPLVSEQQNKCKKRLLVGVFNPVLPAEQNKFHSCQKLDWILTGECDFFSAMKIVNLLLFPVKSLVLSYSSSPWAGSAGPGPSGFGAAPAECS